MIQGRRRDFKVVWPIFCELAGSHFCVKHTADMQSMSSLGGFGGMPPPRKIWLCEMKSGALSIIVALFIYLVLYLWTLTNDLCTCNNSCML